MEDEDLVKVQVPVFKITRCDNGNSFLAVNDPTASTNMLDFLNTFVTLQYTEGKESTFDCGYVSFAYFLDSDNIVPEYVPLSVIGPCECTPCFTLTSCATGEEIFTNNPNLHFYYYNNYVSLEFAELEGRWIISLNQKDLCECAINLTVTGYFESDECFNTRYFKLTNCLNNSIKYSSGSFLVDHLGKYILLKECGGCYLVEEIYKGIPVENAVIIQDSFDTCELCNATYFSLTNCEDSQDVIYTYSNLSSYIDTVVKIDYCDKCWQVEQINYTTDLGQAEIVNVVSNYTTCIECLPSTPEPEPIVYNLQYVNPTFTSPFCTTEYFINTTCTFATHQFNKVISSKYGTKNCCEEITIKETVRYYLLQLELINDVNYVCTPSCDCKCE